MFIVGTSDHNGLGTSGSHQPVRVTTYGQTNAFLAKFDKNGVRKWCTFYGAGCDFGKGCVTDISGNIYIIGETCSITGTAMVTPGCHQNSSGGMLDCFLVKFDTSGVRQWATFFGGAGDDKPEMCTTDKLGNVYIVGQTSSSNGMSTPSVHQPAYAGNNDGFLEKFDSNGFRQWGTYYGGSVYSSVNPNETAYACAIDKTGYIYISGITSHTLNDNAISTPGSHQPIIGGSGSEDIFLVKFNNCQNVLLVASSNSNPICIGQTATVSAITALPNYTWSTGSTANSISVNPTVTTSYTLTAPSFTANCIYATAFTQSVTNTTIAVNSTTACAGISTTLIATGANSYTWSNNSTTNSITVSPTATSVYTVSGSIGTCLDAKTLTISVIQNPTVSVNSASVCQLGTATLIASGANSFSWSTGATSNSITPSIPSWQSLAVYTVTGFTNGCKNSQTATVTAFNYPLINATSTSTAICIGSNITIVATGATSYTWSTGAFSYSINVTPTATTIYTVSGSNYPACISTKTISIIVYVNPTVTVNSGTICNGQSFNLNATGALTYFYNSNPLPQPSGNIVNPSVTTAYTVTGINGTCFTASNATATVFVLPSPSIIATTSNSLICSGQSATLTSSGASTFTWNTASTNTSIVISPTVNTTYTVNGTGANGCDNFATITQSVSLCTDVVALSGDETNTIKIYPNPSNGIFTITCNYISENSILEIYNSTGQLILSQKIQSKNSTVDLSKYADGLYYINANRDQNVFKLIKE